MEGIKIMKIKPLENYHFACYPLNSGLNKRKIYNAIEADNQPNYKKLGLIFVKDILLNKKEYILIK